MSDHGFHFVALGKTLHEQDGRAVRLRFEASRNAHERERVIESDNLAFEIILNRIDYRDMLF